MPGAWPGSSARLARCPASSSPAPACGARASRTPSATRDAWRPRPRRSSKEGPGRSPVRSAARPRGRARPRRPHQRGLPGRGAFVEGSRTSARRSGGRLAHGAFLLAEDGAGPPLGCVYVQTAPPDAPPGHGTFGLLSVRPAAPGTGPRPAARGPGRGPPARGRTPRGLHLGGERAAGALPLLPRPGLHGLWDEALSAHGPSQEALPLRLPAPDSRARRGALRPARP